VTVAQEDQIAHAASRAGEREAEVEDSSGHGVRAAVVLASGGFDPLHFGHVRYLEAARKLGNRLVVVVNCDAWLKRKKGFAFMPEVERVEVLRALRCVDEVRILFSDRDDVAEAIREIRPAIFAKGGDRSLANLPAEEVEACREVNARIIDGVGGGKVQASSWLVRNAKEGRA
jgi:D-beta-D-heptose 7-phosphate kinase/D-beta-D-heptose 1-phosphate adenosyltransferase